MGAAAPPCKSFLRKPEETAPIPFPAHNPCSLLKCSTATACAGSCPNSPLDVPLNKTMESKTTLILEPPISLPLDPNFLGARLPSQNPRSSPASPQLHPRPPSRA